MDKTLMSRVARVVLYLILIIIFVALLLKFTSLTALGNQALLALPVAKAQVRVMDDLGRRMRALTGQMSGKSGARSSDDALLDQLTELAADLEDAISSTQYRFSAGQAYYRQVERRIEELREARLGGVQPFREFTIRRLAPAMAICGSLKTTASGARRGRWRTSIP